MTKKKIYYQGMVVHLKRDDVPVTYCGVHTVRSNISWDTRLGKATCKSCLRIVRKE